MKKITALLIITFLCQNLHSQETGVFGKIEYEQSTHFSTTFYRNFTLKFDMKNSLYEEKVILKENGKMKQTNTDDGQILSFDVVRNNKTPEFFYNDRKNFYFMEIWFDKELLVKEDSFEWQWNLSEEIKKIGGFECQKATIDFRGRTYTAWFTTQIPVPFGPWKFQGLSGIILEIYDADGVFHITAKKIDVSNNSNEKLIMASKKLENPITLIEYLDKKKALIKEDFEKVSSRLPKGYEKIVYDENCDDCSEDIEKIKR